MKERKQEQAKEKFACAKKVFLEVIGKYPYAQAWDPRGWYLSIREASQKTVEKIEKGEVIKMGVEPPQPIEKEIKVKLYDYGLEFPVDYEKYGESNKEAYEWILVAEGSDWFWWYGKDQEVFNEKKFDEIFREALKNVYRCMDQKVPSFLNVPIMENR